MKHILTYFVTKSNHKNRLSDKFVCGSLENCPLVNCYLDGLNSKPRFHSVRPPYVPIIQPPAVEHGGLTCLRICFI